MPAMLGGSRIETAPSPHLALGLQSSSSESIMKKTRILQPVKSHLNRPNSGDCITTRTTSSSFRTPLAAISPLATATCCGSNCGQTRDQSHALPLLQHICCIGSHSVDESISAAGQICCDGPHQPTCERSTLQTQPPPTRSTIHSISQKPIDSSTPIASAYPVFALAAIDWNKQALISVVGPAP